MSSAALMADLGLGPVLAAMLTTFASLAWLTTPIWLSQSLAGHDRSVGLLSHVHPLMAVNATVQGLGLWGSPMGGGNLTYNYLTSLNQDVARPALHSAVGTTVFFAAVGSLLSVCGLLKAWAFRETDTSRSGTNS